MELITRQLCLTQHVGTRDILFGGQMLAWADIAASLWCRLLSKSNQLITVHMSDISFVAPVHVGDCVEFFGESYFIRKSSITVQIVVKISNALVCQTIEAFRFTAVMVNIDRNLKSLPFPEEIQNTGTCDSTTVVITKKPRS